MSKIKVIRGSSDFKIYRSNIIMQPKSLFLFGDNMARVGYGGQAAEMRGEVNSIGIVTKRTPDALNKSAYIYDTDPDIEFIKGIINIDFLRVQYYLDKGDYDKLIIPALGTGLARLPENAPKLLEYIELQIANLYV